MAGTESSFGDTDLVLLQGGAVYSLNKRKKIAADLVIKNGTIDKIGKVDALSFSGRIVDVRGAAIIPGLFDMHVHLREPGREDAETIESGCAAAMAGGVTGVCCMPNTSPPIDSADVVRFVKDKANELLVEVHPIAAITKKRAGEEITEMMELAEAGAVAFSDDGDTVMNGEVMRRALEYSQMLDVPLIQHAEDKWLCANGVMSEGFTSSKLGLQGIPGIAEDVIVARDILLAEFTGGRVHVAHVSTAGTVELIRRGREKGIKITGEVTPHHFTLNEEMLVSFDTHLKMKPPLRSRGDVEAVIEGLRDGTLDVIATDHAPHPPEEKDVEFEAAPFGILGLETALGLIVKYLVEPGTLDVYDALDRISNRPRDILNLDQVEIMEGTLANLTLVDLDAEWQVDASHSYSRSRNTPYHGWKLKGKIMGVVNQGRMWLA